jgi:uncharacterized protein
VLRIVVQDLPDEGTRLTGRVDIDLQGYDEAEDLRVEQPAAYDLEISRLGSTVTIVGQLSAPVQAPCSRCARDVQIAVDRRFEAVFVTADTGEADRAVELDERDLDLDYYQGGVIDGLRLLAEQIFLELPMKVLCAEDCKGLCVQCGANLNETECDCEAEVDPRWAALKGLGERL